MKKLLIIISIFLTATIHSAWADDLADAKALVEGAIITAYKELAAPDITTQARKELALELIDKHISFPAVARLSVGNYWRQMTPEQQVEYEGLFEDWIKFSMSTRIASLNYTALPEVSVTNAYQAKRTSIIETTIKTGDDSIKLQWHIRKFKDGLKIIDVVVEDISMVQAQRAEFTAVIIAAGIDGFLNTLRTMISAVKS